MEKKANFSFLIEGKFQSRLCFTKYRNEKSCEIFHAECSLKISVSFFVQFSLSIHLITIQMFNNYDAKLKQNMLFLYVFILLLGNACKESPKSLPYSVSQNEKSDTAMVVAAHPLATQAGVEIMRQGGNAIDAAIATQFALAVVYPRAGNIGGGGFMVIRLHDGTADALDYREKAPLAAHRDMYLDSLGNPIGEMSQAGHLAVGVPGTVAGMVAAHQKYGQIDNFGDLLAPAIRLAKEGFNLSETETVRLNDYRDRFLKYNKNAAPFVKTQPWQMADLLVQHDLAHTLELIQKNGQKGFYEGETADKFVAEMQRGNGLITHEDLKKYNAVWREPVIGEYKNYRIITMSPPSSGGIALMQMLNILEDYPLKEKGFQSPDALHLMVEAMRRAYADRAEYLGDSDFWPVPTDSLLDEDYLAARMSDFSMDKATASDTLAAGKFTLTTESFETTHTSVVDGEGNAVSVTTTLNLNYGSKVIVEGAGFFLNDEMDDFSAKPGTPNYFGLIGNEANAIQPEKRMLSSMTPTIAEKDGQLFLVLGTPGGSTIITSVLQVFLNVAEFGISVDEAVNAHRFHHQWLPDEIWYEEGGLDTLLKKALMDKGHTFTEKKYLAKMKAIQALDNGQLHGAGDRRNPDDDVESY